MKFIVTDGVDDRVVYARVPENVTLGGIFKNHHDSIELCEVNGILQKNWKESAN